MISTFGTAALVVGRVVARVDVNWVHQHTTSQRNSGDLSRTKPHVRRRRASFLNAIKCRERVRKYGEPPTVPLRIASKVAKIETEGADLKL